mmetsp:Transcript_19887/g.37394  ORF Transcript_19887/g.37394 Transcript_19887/m.37394 type:complete len:108 (-) Transcript_19887:461-784(-)
MAIHGTTTTWHMCSRPDVYSGGMLRFHMSPMRAALGFSTSPRHLHVYTHMMTFFAVSEEKAERQICFDSDGKTSELRLVGESVPRREIRKSDDKHIRMWTRGGGFHR